MQHNRESDKLKNYAAKPLMAFLAGGTACHDRLILLDVKILIKAISGPGLQARAQARPRANDLACRAYNFAGICAGEKVRNDASQKQYSG